MQAIAAENNLAETAFFVPRSGNEYEIRWFTPAVEVELCGHATLAAAHVLYQHLGFAGEEVVFHSRSGPLRVLRETDGRLTLDFPSRPGPSPPTPMVCSTACAPPRSTSWPAPTW
jgi:PhzF family phenazine biosynthesis protein